MTARTTPLWVLLGIVVAGGLGLSLALPSQAATDVERLGRSIYERGDWPSGQPIRATYGVDTPVEGRAAACVNCHRPSGLGSVEGQSIVPPITGRALFGGGAPVIVRADRLQSRGVAKTHEPYSLDEFSRILADGRTPDGQNISALMPRYSFTQTETEALAAYLQTLSTDLSPGVDDTVIHLATVITPGNTESRKTAFLLTLKALVAQLNVTSRPTLRQKASPFDRRYGSHRQWELAIWSLNGPSNTWAEQLRHFQAKQPVFAVVSGLGDTEWQPVQDFCDAEQVPCWFPSLNAAPLNAADSRYAFYFSAGIGTESSVLAQRFAAMGGKVVQVVGATSAAAEGAKRLRAGLNASDRLVEFKITAAGLMTDLASLRESDAIVFWLTPAELQSLRFTAKLRASSYLSSTLGMTETVDLPQALGATSLIQLEETPDLRANNLERLQTWLSASNIPVVDLRMQSEVRFAVRYLASSVRSMLSNLYTPYLVERGETMIGSFEAMAVNDEVMALQMGPVNKSPLSDTLLSADSLGRIERAREHLDDMRARGGTTVYPRLSLGVGQRFASKGAYVEPLRPNVNGAISPEWVVAELVH